MSEQILVVDDEKELADLIEVYLKNDGYTVYKFYNGMDALKCFYYPVIMLTAKGEDVDKIMGLTIGADDYITKPFNPIEVVARVKTQLRRYKQYNNLSGKQKVEVSEYDIRGLLINKNTHKCYLYGKDLQLTPIEFSILWYLCERPGRATKK